MRWPGSWYPGGGRCIRLTPGEHRALTAAQIRELSLDADRALAPEPEPGDLSPIAAAEKFVAKVLKEVRVRKPGRERPQRMTRKRLEERLALGLRIRNEGRNLLEELPCVRNLVRTVLRGTRPGIGFDGRRKLFSVIHEMGVDEADVIDLLLASPRAADYVATDLVPDTRENPNASGYRIHPRYRTDLPTRCDDGWSFCQPLDCPLRQHRPEGDGPSGQPRANQERPPRPPDWTFAKAQAAAGQTMDGAFNRWFRRDPGRERRQPPPSTPPPTPANADDFQLLGIPPTTDAAAVAAAFRKQARTHHPDHGGDGSRMAKILDAYHRLRTRLAGE
ncbi:MAG: J domain-containing protein [Chloroflexota bacterium]